MLLEKPSNKSFEDKKKDTMPNDRFESNIKSNRNYSVPPKVLRITINRRRAHTSVYNKPKELEHKLIFEKSTSQKYIYKFSNRGEIIKKSIIEDQTDYPKKTKSEKSEDEPRHESLDKEESSKNTERKSSNEEEITSHQDKKKKGKSKKNKMNKKKKKNDYSDNDEKKSDSEDDDESDKKTWGKRGSKTSKDAIDKKKKKR